MAYLINYINNHYHHQQHHRSMFTTRAISVIFLFLCILINNGHNRVSCSTLNEWNHSIDLDENFRVLWNLREQEITFEIQVRTTGYVGFGFSRDGTIYNADIAIGWIDAGHAYFQVGEKFLCFIIL